MTSISALVGGAASSAKRSRLYSRALRHNPALQRTIARSAAKHDRASEVDQAAVRQAVLRRSLRWASKTPYGSRLDVDNPERLLDWPTLKKSTLRDDESHFFSSSRMPAISASTGGTTGTPLRLRRSLVSLNAEQFFLGQVLAPHGLSFASSKMAILRGDNVKDPSNATPPFGRYDFSDRHLVLSSQHLNADSLSWYVNELRGFEPDFLWAYPSTLSSLVRLIVQAGSELSIPIIVTSSEMLYPNEADLAAEVLGARLVDYYGQAERVSLASNTKGDGYRFLPLYGSVELRPTDVTSAEGHSVAEVIGTSHWNSAMPLVRYLVGDAIVYESTGADDQLARIATGLEPFFGLQGRSGDYLVSPEGGILVGIDHLARGLESVVRMQIRQDSLRQVKILVVTTGDFLEADKIALDKTCALKLPSTMSIDVEHVEDLPRTAAGKTPFVIRAAEVDRMIA